MVSRGAASTSMGSGPGAAPGPGARAPPPGGGAIGSPGGPRAELKLLLRNEVIIIDELTIKDWGGYEGDRWILGI